ncbi:MAG: AAA family ATPase [Candidatus Harrisonbacteria bacterium]|nr:AAA family ATPase [Candidatus Harrisonbacteria bacterium]
MKGITLIGMPGVGKSTIGKLLAEKLNYKFIDLDVLIKEKTGKSHADIIKERGERELIKFEGELACGLDLTETVFAPGGSIIYFYPAMEKLEKETAIIYLSLPLSEIGKRLAGRLETRGIVGLTRWGIEGVFVSRSPLYQLFARHVVECQGLDEEKIADRIYALLQHQP